MGEESDAGGQMQLSCKQCLGTHPDPDVLNAGKVRAGFGSSVSVDHKHRSTAKGINRRPLPTTELSWV